MIAPPMIAPIMQAGQPGRKWSAAGSCLRRRESTRNSSPNLRRTGWSGGLVACTARTPLDVASTVALLASYGVQARHLRAARTAAERDVALIEQVVAPTLRQRSPQARDEAARTAGQIAHLLIRLHSAMIEAGLAEAGLPAECCPNRSCPDRGARTMPRHPATACEGPESRVRAREAECGRRPRECRPLLGARARAGVWPRRQGVYVDKGVPRALQGYEAQVRTETR